ncbi:Btz domain-containing protein [Favolaschia claudopus]|uniref:Btz domain-containing protein n=1 Tax=Favolaschia claudopus TaxID=2862362 RepID=A0AAW0DR31_9AGAR
MPSKRPAARRRGRGPQGSEFEEEEVERAARSDTDESEETDEDDEDESDSESEPDEPVSRRLTPNTSHSPDDDQKAPSFFAATPATWADLVEGGDDTAALPVISFADLDANAVHSVRIAEPQHESTDDEPEQQQQDIRPVASSSRHPPPPPSRPAHSARQAYQQRLDSDPSFVPVVGEFWGHDDRLLDKDLRSLSGWWRGRWQGRGRARGNGFPPSRGRGRGGFSQSGPSQEAPPAAVSPMDRAWTHDGYEEMQRRREETRNVRPPQFPPRGGPPNSMRGSPTFRARGMNMTRLPGRIWFTMKPEHMWTKQHDAFLYLDHALKARPGQPPGVRVRLPGANALVIRAIPRPTRAVRLPQKRDVVDNDYVVRLPPRAGKGKAASPTTQDDDDDDEAFTVKLPPQPQAQPLRMPTPPPANANPLQPDADGWVQPTPAAVALAEAAASPPAVAAPILPQTQQQQQAPPPFFPFAPPALNSNFTFPPQAAPVSAYHTPAPPNFPQNFQTHTPPPGFSTHTPPPLGFGTPPPFSQALPPGVAIDVHGMPFELASGRPVVLQPAAVMYAPQPFVHHHHQHSMSMPMSMGGHGHGHTPSMGMGMPLPMNGVNGAGGPGPDPAMFAFARTGRVEIRPPPGVGSPPQTTIPTPRSPLSPSPLSPRKEAGALGSTSGQQKQKLRTGAAAFVPSHGGTASMSLSVSLPAPEPYFAAANGNAGYENGGGVNGAGVNGGVIQNGYEANGYHNDAGAGYDVYGGGGGGYGAPGGGTTYYYPYYTAPPAAGDGTVYYQ